MPRGKAVSKPNAENKALTDFKNSINSKYDKGAIFSFDDDSVENIVGISTGSFSLDRATGVGGFPAGRIAEIYGGESSGKTTLALNLIAAAQRSGKRAYFIDTEYAFSLTYAKALGVDISKLDVSQPDTAEQALDQADMAVTSGMYGIIVLDSVAGLVPKAELEGEIGDSHMGLNARLMSQAMRKLTGNVKKSDVLMVFINQLRQKIGMVFGNPNVTTGGLALKYFASMRIELTSKEKIMQGQTRIGTVTKARIMKNKMAPPFKEANFEIIFGKGISYAAEILENAVEYNLIEKAGSHYSYDKQKIGASRVDARIWLEQHPEDMETIKNLILGKGPLDTVVTEQEIEDAKKDADTL